MYARNVTNAGASMEPGSTPMRKRSEWRKEEKEKKTQERTALTLLIFFIFLRDSGGWDANDQKLNA